MAKVTISLEKCDGAECGECAEVCSREILILNGNQIKVQKPEECSLCEICMDACSNGAIKLE